MQITVRIAIPPPNQGIGSIEGRKKKKKMVPGIDPQGGFDNELKGRKGSEQDMEDTRQNRDMVKVIREKQ